MPSARPAACCPNIRVQVKVVSGGSACLSWRKRLLQARRALVARPGAQLARGAAVYAPPCQSVLWRLALWPSCPAFQASQSDSSAWCDRPDRRQEKRSCHAAAGQTV